MPFAEIFRESPNCASAQEPAWLGVVLHHTVMSYEATIERMLDPASRVSYHVVIAKTGERCALVTDERIAWHAGVSSFQGRQNCNAFMLGVGFEGDTYRDPLTDAQIASALDWLAPRWARYGWTPAWITDHRQVAPGRKDDLNPAEWARISALIAQAAPRLALKRVVDPPLQ